MANDHVIASVQFTFVVINMKAVQYYLDARKLSYTKRHLDVMRCAIRPCGFTVFHLIGTHLALVSPAIIVALCSLSLRY